MYYRFYFYQKVSLRKENVIKKVTKKRKYICRTILYLSTKPTYKRTREAQTLVVQGQLY